MENSHIQWTDHTFNPWEGCTKVSPGCLNCYAEARNIRFSEGRNWGKGAPRRRTGLMSWNSPRRWQREYLKDLNDWRGHEALHGGSARYPEPVRPKVFCASLADWLDPEIDPMWLADLLNLIAECSELNWLLLSKRPELWRQRMEDVTDVDGDNKLAWKWIRGDAPANVWAMTSVEDQARANLRIRLLMEIPAKIHGLSVEPMLENIDFKFANLDPFANPDWAIFGGESGPDCRPCEKGWLRNGVEQCRIAGVAAFVKQLGGHPDKRGELMDLPPDLRVRKFPA